MKVGACTAAELPQPNAHPASGAAGEETSFEGFLGSEPEGPTAAEDAGAAEVTEPAPPPRTKSASAAPSDPEVADPALVLAPLLALLPVAAAIPSADPAMIAAAAAPVAEQAVMEGESVDCTEPDAGANRGVGAQPAPTQGFQPHDTSAESRATAVRDVPATRQESAGIPVAKLRAAMRAPDEQLSIPSQQAEFSGAKKLPSAERQPLASFAAARPGEQVRRANPQSIEAAPVPPRELSATPAVELQSPAQPAAAAARATEPSREMIALLDRVHESVERMRTSGPERMEIAVRLRDGAELTVKLHLERGELHTVFRTGSDSLREALEQSWPQFAARSPDRTVRVHAPIFESGQTHTGMSDAGSQPRRDRAEQTWPEPPHAVPQAPRRAPQNAPQKPDTSSGGETLYA